MTWYRKFQAYWYMPRIQLPTNRNADCMQQPAFTFASDSNSDSDSWYTCHQRPLYDRFSLQEHWSQCYSIRSQYFKLFSYFMLLLQHEISKYCGKVWALQMFQDCVWCHQVVWHARYTFLNWPSNGPKDALSINSMADAPILMFMWL